MVATGGNAVAVIRRTGVTMNAGAPASSMASSPTHPAVPVMSSPTHPAVPVMSSPTPHRARVSSPTPPAQSGGTQLFPYAVDAALASGERMM